MPMYIPEPLPPAPWHNIEVHKKHLEVLSSITDVSAAYLDTIGVFALFSRKKSKELKSARKRYDELNKEYQELWVKS